MHRRTCAATLLCAPLVAGCGSSTHVDFAAHSRPAIALEISVLMGRYGATFDPRQSGIRPGPVLLNISNQSPYEVWFSVRKHGRTIARTPAIAPGQPAQLKVTLSGSGITFNTHGVSARDTLSTSQELKLEGPPRSGENDVAQP